MANIRITVEGPLMDGHKITFKAPCNCSVVEKLDVRYIEKNEQKNKLFTMKDSHGNDLTGLGNLFSEGAYVDVVLDPNSGSAYLQNAGTNGYLEEKTTPVDNLLSDRADLPLSAKQGKVLNESLDIVNYNMIYQKVGVLNAKSSVNVNVSLTDQLIILIFGSSAFGNHLLLGRRTSAPAMYCQHIAGNSDELTVETDSTTGNITITNNTSGSLVIRVMSYKDSITLS